jgi:predicted metal-dependent peptidase
VKLKLSEFFLALITDKSFYGRLVSSLQRVSKPGLGTMAVGLRNGRATFFYDPEFIEKIPFKAAMFAIEHEMLHLVLDHIPRYLELLSLCQDDMERKKAGAVYNIAMDAAINTMLRNHKGFDEAQAFLRGRIKEEHPDAPKEVLESEKNGMILPENFDLPVEGHFEFYQWTLMKRVNIIEIAVSLLGANTHEMWTGGEEPGEGQGQGAGGMDPGENPANDGDKGGKGKNQGKGQGKSGQGNGGGKQGDIIFTGSTFKDMSPEELLSAAHRIREQIKETLRQTVRSMGGIGRGTLPSGMEEWLELYLAEPIIPWWEIFSSRARMSRVSKFRRSVTVPNRALLALSEEDSRIIPAPGRVRDKAWRVFLYVDTSGSMSTESLEIVKSELQHMLNTDESMEIRYMQGDAATHLDVVLHTGDEIPGQMVGRGGTDFDAYFIHMGQYVADDNKAPDIVIVYTDGYAPAVDEKNRLPAEIPVLWLVTPQHSAHFDDYGEVIVCEAGHNERYKH